MNVHIQIDQTNAAARATAAAILRTTADLIESAPDRMCLRLARPGERWPVLWREAEPLAPESWNLALHHDPNSDCWAVSDIPTGRLIAVGSNRHRAVCTAVERLRTLAEQHQMTIPELLDHARARVAQRLDKEESK